MAILPLYNSLRGSSLLFMGRTFSGGVKFELNLKIKKKRTRNNCLPYMKFHVPRVQLLNLRPDYCIILYLFLSSRLVEFCQ